MSQFSREAGRFLGKLWSAAAEQGAADAFGAQIGQRTPGQHHQHASWVAKKRRLEYDGRHLSD